MWLCRQVVILEYGVVAEVVWAGELVALSGHIIVVIDPCMVGVEMKIHRFDVMTMGGKADGV